MTTTVFDAFWHDCLCPDAFIANSVPTDICPTHADGVLETHWTRTGYASCGAGCADCETNETRAIEQILGFPLADTGNRCHEVSLALVRSGIYGHPGTHARVARGFCDGVAGQHSWIVRDHNPYALGVPIVDPTLWAHTPTTDPEVWHGHAASGGRHRPHGGAGSIWTYGKPCHQGGETIELTPAAPLSELATLFLSMVGPLDRPGWMLLGNAPVGGWCAAEIFAAMADTKPLSQMVPIDVLGMVTDRNPGGLYW